MDKESLAAMLNGREYRSEITKAEEKSAYQNGLVVLFGASDDLAEFRGVFDDEIGCYGGGELFLTNKGPLPEHEDNCDCVFCGYERLAKLAVKIEAVWDSEGYSWIYKTDIPHATFDIMDGDEKYCRGIVFESIGLPNQ